MTVTQGTFVRSHTGVSSGDNTHPRFFVDSVHDVVASERLGRPIFRDEERVEIIMPGNPHTRPVSRVTQEHKDRWPTQYEAFQRGLTLSPDGTPIEEWSILKRSQVLELKALGFATVEQIAAMNDHAIQRIGLGGRMLRERAAAFLDDAAAVQLTEQLTAQNSRFDAENAALKHQVSELGKLVEKL